MSTPQRSVRFGPEARRAFARWAQAGQNESKKMNIMIDRYAQIMIKTPLPDLTPDDWRTIRAALGGRCHEPAAMIAGLWDEIAEAIKYGDSDCADPTALQAKLSKLTVAQEVRVIEECERARHKNEDAL